jgi:hypothetical protein
MKSQHRLLGLATLVAILLALAALPSASGQPIGPANRSPRCPPRMKHAHTG